MVRDSFPGKETFKKRLEGVYNHMVLHMASVGSDRDILPRSEYPSNLCWADSKIIG